MKRRGRFQRSLVLILLMATASTVNAADRAAQSLAGRPYYSLFGASIDRLVAVCNAIFESVDRPDLAASLVARQKSYRDFAGIDPTKPLGMMSVWNNAGSADVVFLPVKDIKELMRTATFDIVGFHPVGPDRFEIERPGSPYHVLVRKDYAFFADAPSTVQALQVTPEQLTRGLRDRYDIVLHLDLKQIPQPIKVDFVDGVRARIEPWLQPQDDEAAETRNLRKVIGKLVLDLFQRLVLDTNSVMIGGRLDSKTRHFIFEVVIEAAQDSAMAKGLNRLVSHRNEFTSLISPDVPAGLALNLPLGGLVEQVLGQPGDPPAKGSRLEAGLQLVGSGLGKLSLITALRGDGTAELNNAIPHLILKLDRSGKFVAVHENFGIHEGVVLHSLVPHEMPTAMTNIVGTEVEILIGQGKQTVWLAIGQPETLPDHLKSAISLVDEPSSVRAAAPLVRARFQANNCRNCSRPIC